MIEQRVEVIEIIVAGGPEAVLVAFVEFSASVVAGWCGFRDAEGFITSAEGRVPSREIMGLKIMLVVRHGHWVNSDDIMIGIHLMVEFILDARTNEILSMKVNVHLGLFIRSISLWKVYMKMPIEEAKVRIPDTQNLFTVFPCFQIQISMTAALNVFG